MYIIFTFSLSIVNKVDCPKTKEVSSFHSFDKIRLQNPDKNRSFKILIKTCLQNLQQTLANFPLQGHQPLVPFLLPTSESHQALSWNIQQPESHQLTICIYLGQEGLSVFKAKK